MCNFQKRELKVIDPYYAFLDSYAREIISVATQLRYFHIK